ncbi:MAG: hypothetical protein AAFZ15_22420 [Bacteroidota bacterium]
MKQPRWKVWLSYFTELVLERDATDLNPDLQLGFNKGRYCLSTPNAIYSYGDLYDNFYKAFQQINIKSLALDEVLVLGFGLGSVPYMLEKSFQKKCTYTGVELDETIVRWATDYILDELESPVQLIISDAAIFTEISQQKFDLIAMDIFIDNEIPAQFESIAFLENLDSMLKEGGRLMYNRLALQDIDRKHTEDFFKTRFKSVFPKARYLDVGGNWILLNY